MSPVRLSGAQALPYQSRRRRLEGRATDAPEVIEQRLAKAAYELTFAPQFDRILVNDNLEVAEQEALAIVKAFLGCE